MSALAPSLVRPFQLERFFAVHEFSTRHLLCCSDVEPATMAELLALADAECKALWDGLTLGYTESGGLPLLREAIAKLYGGAVCADDVLCCVPMEGILLAHALLRPGDHVVATAPGYQSLTSLAEDLGCEVSLWAPVRSADGAALEFQVDELARLLRPGRTRVVFVNFPHNPTGCCPSSEEWGRAVEAVAGAGAILFSDEMYAGLWGAPGGGPPPALAAALSPTAVSLGGLSKTHGLAGLRSGWLVTRDPAVRARLASAKDFTTICQSAPTEVLALIALRSGAALLARARAIVGANLPAVNAWFAARPALFWWSPPAGGGTTGVARLLGGERAASFCARALAGCGVLLLPLSEYHHPEAGGGAVGADCVRVGFARRDMPQVLAALGAWLDAGGAAAPPASGPGAATA